MRIRGRRQPSSDDLIVIIVSSFVFLLGLVLFIDDVWLHFLGDLSAWDNYNPYTQHWMVGVALMLFAPILYYYLKK